ncbi:phospho-sugar mutase [Paraliobacillus sp. X-1268]|uniref:phospho-sugar mutase n=1 Tax=Paraliobacillus sp. X-1268 TaxID=2213193 RepID=UPI000E3DE120|nr:phospho-sugar mutase [Paraliobacillus sp. X-1268]
MDWIEEYEKWKQFDDLDSGIRHQLKVFERDLSELEDCFDQTITFDQVGMCGEIGPGPNRINIYTIRKAAEGLARYMEAQSIYHRVRGVVIAYDSRFRSTEFALEVVKTLGIHGIPVYLFDRLRPVPLLNFAIRYLHAYAGVMITAGQHTAEYNGFRVYGPDGENLSDEEAGLLIYKVNQVKEQLAIKIADKDELLHLKLLKILHDNELERAYMMELKKITGKAELIQAYHDLCIVYTPLHGAGNSLVRNCFDSIGFTNVHVVVEQELADPTFSTVTCLNPEDIEAYTLAIEYGARLDAAILFATDPDVNQVGVAVKNCEDIYQVLTKTERNALLLDYLNNIVNMPLNSGQEFLKARDAVQICMLLAEVAVYYKSKAMTLFEGLLEITEKSGG